MSPASRSVKRLRELYASIIRRMRKHEARLADPLAGRIHFSGIEQLEPRLLLSTGEIWGYWNGTIVNIPDNGGTSGNYGRVSLNVSGAPSNATITDVDIYYEIKHTFVGDIKAWATLGSAADDWVMWNREGGDADNIAEWEVGIDKWDGRAANQTWWLVAGDYWGGDTGYLDFFEVHVHWYAPDPPPDLTPYRPSGWSDKIVVSTDKGDNSDDSPIFSDQTIYIDWAVTNDGDGPATSAYYTALYVDGGYWTRWNNPAPHDPGYYKYIQDYSVGTLSGTQHTIEIRADYLNAIVERDDSAADNNYTRTITVYDRPDLIVQSVTGTAASYNLGDKISATATIKNQGGYAAGSSHIRYYLGTADGSDKTYRPIEGPSDIGSLSVYGTENDIINWPYWTIPNDVASGSYRVWVLADSEGDVWEGSAGEDNNWGSSASFAVIGLDQSPTLTLTGPGSNVTVTQGQAVTITWTDSDPDDNAFIGLACDPDTNSTPWTGTNNHSWLTVSLTEDPDGSGDQYTWDTTGVAPGIYSVWGVIYDGTNPEVYSRALGLVTIEAGRYMLQGSFRDAEKDSSPGDDLLCWAAAASNVLAWTGWGDVTGMNQDEDTIFDYVEAHWTNLGNRPQYAWDWWFDGTGEHEPGGSSVDVAGGGFYPAIPIGSYMHVHGDPLAPSYTGAMEDVSDDLKADRGTTVFIHGGNLSVNHELTVWGFDYDSSTPNYFTGIWVTDSDDSMDTGQDYLLHYTLLKTDDWWVLWDGERYLDGAGTPEPDYNPQGIMRYRNSAIVAAQSLARRPAQITEAPIAPAWLNATDTLPDKVTITWGSSDRADSYDVYRGTTDDFGSAGLLWGDVAGTICDDTTATPGTTYYYWVKAKNTSGSRGVSPCDLGGRVIPNSPPTNIALSNSSVPENQPSGTVVGNLSTTDPDAGDTFVYSLVPGTGSADNGSFTISGNQLRTTASFNYEAKNSYSIRVCSTDQGGTGLSYEKVFTISVTNINEQPTNIAVSSSSVPENQPSGTVVGNVSTTDPDAGDTFVYSLVPGTGSADNGSFTISGNQLRTTASFNYEAKNSYSIRVCSTDQGGTGLSYEKVFTITVTDEPDDQVVARRLFYNNSYLDGNNALANASDDNAIDNSKSALLPGGIATFANCTSYRRGINGVMVDISNLVGTLSASDFMFRVGNATDPSTWTVIPPAPCVTVRQGAGAGGSDRVTLTWADGAIQNEWLQVRVLSDANGGHAGLAQDDMFYFGNLSGDANGDGSVDAADYIAVKQGFGSSVTSPGGDADFDCSGTVDYGDLLALIGSVGGHIQMFEAPALPVVIDFGSGDGIIDASYVLHVAGKREIRVLAGGTVTVVAGGELIAEDGDLTIEASSIVLSGGTVQTTGDGQVILNAGNIDVATSATLGGTLILTKDTGLTVTGQITTTGDIIVAGNITVDYAANAAASTSTLTLNAGGGIIINNPISLSTTDNAGDTFTLNLNATGGVDINAAINNTSGNGKIVLTSKGTTFDNTSGAITTTGGAVDINNTGAVTIGAAINAGAGPVTIDGTGAGTASIGGAGLITTSNTLTMNAVGAIGAASMNLAATGPIVLTSGTNATFTNTSAVNLGACSIGGNLIATATTGNITDSGTVTVGGTASFTTSASNADIDLGTLAVTGTIDLTTTGATGNAAIVNATAVDLAAMSIGGTLAVTATAGDITDSGVITAGGTASFTTSAANATIDLGTLAVTGTIDLATSGAAGHATIVNATAVDLPAMSIGGNLAVTATAGNITDSGTITVGGTATFTTGAADADISLGTLASTGAVSVNTNGVVSDATIVNSIALDLAASTVGRNLTVTATTGNITDSGVITAGGTASFTTSAANADIDLGTLAVTGTIDLATTGATGNAAIVNATGVDLAAMGIGGNLAVTATAGDITDSGTVTVGGTATFTTSALNADIDLGTLAATGNVSVKTHGETGNATIVNSIALKIGASSVGGNLTATATTGNLTANLSGAETILAGGTVRLVTLALDADILGPRASTTLADVEAARLELVTNGAGGDVGANTAAGKFVVKVNPVQVDTSGVSGTAYLVRIDTNIVLTPTGASGAGVVSGNYSVSGPYTITVDCTGFTSITVNDDTSFTTQSGVLQFTNAAGAAIKIMDAELWTEGGNIVINSSSLNILEGAGTITTSPLLSTAAGTVNINCTTFSMTAGTIEGGRGNAAGGVNITTPIGQDLQINGGRITASGSGALQLTAGQNFVVNGASVTSTQSGAINITAAGDITVNNAIAASGATVHLEAAGSILGGPAAATDVIAERLELLTAGPGGDVGTPTNVFIVEASEVDTSGVSGTAYINVILAMMASYRLETGLELPPSPVADAQDADILAIAASVLGNRLATNRQAVPAATLLTNPLPPSHVAIRVGPLPTFPSPLLSLGRSCPVVADVLRLAAPWWSGNSAKHEALDEPWTVLTVDIAGKPRKSRFGPIVLDALAVTR